MLLELLFFSFLIGLCDLTDHYDDYHDIKNIADKLTRLLCEAGKVFRGEKEPSQELLDWWKDHQEKDKKRGK